MVNECEFRSSVGYCSLDKSFCPWGPVSELTCYQNYLARETRDAAADYRIREQARGHNAPHKDGD